MTFGDYYVHVRFEVNITYGTPRSACPPCTLAEVIPKRRAAGATRWGQTQNKSVQDHTVAQPSFSHIFLFKNDALLKWKLSLELHWILPIIF